MSEYDPARDGPYGAWLRAKGIQIIPRGRTHATKDQVREGRTEDGVRWKRVRDQLGHEVTQYATGRQDVRINFGLRGADAV